MAGGILVGLILGVAGVIGDHARNRIPPMKPVIGMPPPMPVVLDVPWLMFGSVLVGLPLLAALVAGALTRTRAALTRRLT
ncbi:hypothetical protein ACFQX6_53185 [Streptosporangium lutulentum]